MYTAEGYMETQHSSFPEVTQSKELQQQIAMVMRNIPRIEYHPRTNGEIDYYGGSYYIAEALGLKKPLMGRATWMHGWFWHDISGTDYIARAESRNIRNLVSTKELEEFLKANGFPNAVAAGLPILYTPPVEVPRIPDSLLVMPTHITQCCSLKLTEKNTAPYVEYLTGLCSQFSLITACLGFEDIRRGNWIAEFEQAGIPWVAGAWTHDRNALVRIQALMRQFEFVTTNAPGSHIAYAAYCGCKTSFTGPRCDTLGSSLSTHPFYKQNPHLAKEMKQWDQTRYFSSRHPQFCVAPREATTHTRWAEEQLGMENKKRPEEIAELFEWKLRKLPSGKWAPANPLDALTNEEIFAKAMAKSMVGAHEEAFQLTNTLHRRHVRMQDVDIIRARYFLNLGNTHGARESLKEELRHFPDNEQAQKMLKELGNAPAPHVAKNEEEREFIELINTVRPFTRLNFKRAKSLYTLAVRVCQENIPGNFVECGVAAGGSTMLLALVVQRYSKIPRKVFAFDTFTGMPDPDERDTAQGVPADETGWGTGTCAAPEEFVRDNCRRLGVGDIVETRKGLFCDSLPVHREEIGTIGLLHMDADWYSSTMDILNNLFDQIHPDALIQIDDYRAWDGCKKAIMEYSAQHNLVFDIHEIDGTGVWCANPAKKRPPTPAPQPPADSAFLSPVLTPDFADLFHVRSAILRELEDALPRFRGTFLDVVCGKMPYREYILGRNPKIERYIGLDFATGKYADLRQPDLTWDGITIPLPDGSVDSVMATEVLEHCEDPISVLREIRRVLAPEGTFFFTTPFLWPIHDAPHDHYRYTPYAMERILAEAGFGDIVLKALGGWNASLAQMIGLWLRRAPMPKETREQLTRDLYPFVTELARTDTLPVDFGRNPMITGLAGTARPAQANIQTAPDGAGKRVVVITDQFPVLSQTFILDQMTGLMDRGLALEHWSLERVDDTVVHEKVRRYGLLENTRYVTLPPESLQGSPARWTTKFLTYNGLRPLDDVAAVQIHFGPNFNKFAPLFRAYPNLFVVVSFHGYDGSATLRIKSRDIYRELFARADMLTTPSEFMKNNLVAHGCSQEKVTVHHYGKDTTQFTPALRNGSRKQVRLLSIARFVEKKGLEYAIAAFAKAQAGFDVQYRIIGYGPLYDTLMAMAVSLGVADRVVFLGQLPGDQVVQEMAEADIFVLTSVTAANGDEEGVPVSLIEAQASGLPVVSSLHAGIPELVTHGKSGFLAEERNVEEIAGYMRVLIKNPAIRASFSAAAREHVLREFDIETLNTTLARYLSQRGQKSEPTVPAQSEAAPVCPPVANTASAASTGVAEPAKTTEHPKQAPTEVYCPVCGSSAPSFNPFGVHPRPNAMCPNCNSLERHRFLWAYLERYSNLLSAQDLRMLHFAPEACLGSKFRKLIGKGYITADLMDPKADVQADITNLQFRDASFNTILCSHVLEHVPDDSKAMRELHRVLTDDGVAIIMVPFRNGRTEEDLSITAPEERARRYGQSDHVRYYGTDIVDRLQSVGFAVRSIHTNSVFSADEIEHMRMAQDCIFLCTKQDALKKSGPDTPRSVKTDRKDATGQLNDMTAQRVATHWASTQSVPRSRWWMHPGILRHVNKVVCGSSVDGPWTGLQQRMCELTEHGTFSCGISVGCGSAGKELALLQKGIVRHFDLYELCPERLEQGKREAARLGLTDRASFHARSPLAQNINEQYDLVYWNNALHHMPDALQALQWSRNCLLPGGWLVMDDYVGASRFQWPDSQLRIASRIRRALPDRLRQVCESTDRATHTNQSVPPKQMFTSQVTRPSVAGMIASDPSEAADSANILPALKRIFPDARIIPTGGVIYNLALKDVIANFDDVRDAALLADLLEYDAILAEQGETQYACAFAHKQAEASIRP
jgi:glycosyltransferase involved in cell wall biosynthesis/SAM-dependent methyltransferase